MQAILNFFTTLLMPVFMALGLVQPTSEIEPYIPVVPSTQEVGTQDFVPPIELYEEIVQVEEENEVYENTEQLDVAESEIESVHQSVTNITPVVEEIVGEESDDEELQDPEALLASSTYLQQEISHYEVPPAPDSTCNLSHPDHGYITDISTYRRIDGNSIIGMMRNRNEELTELKENGYTPEIDKKLREEYQDIIDYLNGDGNFHQETFPEWFKEYVISGITKPDDIFYSFDDLNPNSICSDYLDKIIYELQVYRAEINENQASTSYIEDPATYNTLGTQSNEIRTRMERLELFKQELE